MPRTNKLRQARLLAIPFVIAGCATMDNTRLPTVTAKMAGHGVSTESLEAGRAVLATRCVSCHGLEPIAKYSENDWRRIVEGMGPRARLDAREERDLLAYLIAARAAVSNIGPEGH